MGVGMPHCLMLHQFGQHLYNAFGKVAYWVGSSLGEKTDWRDVDVRVLIPDEEYRALGYGDPEKYPHGSHENAKWVSTVLAWSYFGRHLTGLPIDFQIQPLNWANEHESGNRGALLDLALVTEISKAYYRGREEPK
jgi:hypothetical protein